MPSGVPGRRRIGRPAAVVDAVVDTDDRHSRCLPDIRHSCTRRPAPRLRRCGFRSPTEVG